MLTVRIVPCLDTADGRVVKGVKFAGLRDAGDPVARATAYEAQGADELVLLDVSATPEGRGHALGTVRDVRHALSIPLTVGGGWEVVVRSGRERTGRDAVRWAREAVDAGAGEILLTSLDRDGTRLGYDLELLREIAGAVRVPIVASGGADSPAHLLAAIRAGANAVLAASIFHDGDCTVGDVKVFLAANGVEVRS
jgi:imidazole glycerol phosphate synthase subunit HisF